MIGPLVLTLNLPPNINYNDYFGAHLESNLIWPERDGNRGSRDEERGMRDDVCCSHLWKTIQELSSRKEKQTHRSMCNVSTFFFLSLLGLKVSLLHQAVNSESCICLYASSAFSPSAAVNLWSTEKVTAHTLEPRCRFTSNFKVWRGEEQAVHLFKVLITLKRKDKIFSTGFQIKPMSE